MMKPTICDKEMMTMKTAFFPLLQAPLTVGKVTMPNRIVVPPMADIAQKVPGHFITDYMLNRYKAYAEGAPGMIIVEGSNVTDMRDVREAIGLWDDEFIPRLQMLAGTVKSGGSVGLIQISNVGLKVMDVPSIADISRDDFLSYKQDFISAALRCREAGFDGVELQGAHGYFLNQVIETSTRADEYGGSFGNRIRLINELVHDIKQTCGDDFLVTARIGYPDIDGLTALARSLEDSGADMLSISTGSRNYDVPADFPVDSKIFAAWKVKESVSIPVIAVGNIKTGSDGEFILSRGYADCVAVGRSHQADPAWAGKVLAGKEPNPCLRCKPCRWFKNSAQCPAIHRNA